MREWKPWEYKGVKYEVCNDGRIYSFHTHKILKPKVTKKGYLQVHVGGREGTYKQLHRIIAEVFIPNPNNLPQVNHKDDNKLNNSADNLEWCTNKYNANYGNRNYNLRLSHAKPIINKETGQCFLSVGECSDWFSIPRQTVHYWIKNGRYEYL